MTGKPRAAGTAVAGQTPPGQARLSVQLIGELELRRGPGGAALELPPSRRARALLGYLVATGVPHSRAALCDLLWDGSDDPRAALRWSLAKLRPLVDDGALLRLHADRERVRFDASHCDVDALPARGWPDEGQLDRLPLEVLENAAAALRGEFLDGLDLPACYRFQHWCMAERERCARRRRLLLEALVARLADMDPERAQQHARAMVAADPLSEPAHAALVKLLAAMGRYPEAESHYGWARELLRRELSLPDGGVLDQSIRAVRQAQQRLQRPATDGSAATAPPAAAERATASAVTAARPSAALGAPLVGRAAECRTIVAALQARAALAVLLFVGEPGMGKTRLLDYACERAAERGRLVLRARCFEAESVRPYGFWLDAFRAVRTQGIAEPVLAGVSALLGGRSDTASRERLFDAAAELLHSLAQRQTLLVVADDVQWIDDASAALLHFVMRRLQQLESPAALALAARVGELDDNAAARGLLQSLARECPLQRLDLRGLAADDIQQWLGPRLADPAEALRASGGNPLFLIELAEAGVTTSDTRPLLRALIEERLRPLDDASRDLLGWCAAFGGEFSAELLAMANALPLAEVLARIAVFERRRLLCAADNGGFDFVHGLVRQTVYAGLATPRRRALHRQLAQAFAQAATEDPWQHGAVVHHAALGGDSALAARAALAAGEHWLRVFANVEAGQVADRGLAMVDALAPGASRVRLEIGLLRLRVAAAAAPGGGRRVPDLSSRIQQAIDAAQQLDLPADAAAAWEILAYSRQQAGNSAGAREATLAAERCTRRADAQTHCRQLANTGRCLLDIESDVERARGLLAEAEALADELHLPVMELEWGRGLAARADGNLPAAHDALSRAVALARAAANHWREYECMLALATLEFELGRFDGVLQHVDDVREAARRMGDAHVPFADALAALSHLRRGDAGAGPALSASLVALRERDDKAHLAYALNEAAAAALAGGDRASAEQLAREALAAGTAVRRPTLIQRSQSLAAAAAAPAACAD